MKLARILHIAQDEKFINAAHYLFEKAFPDSNDFIIIKPPANPPTKYICKEVESGATVEIRSEDTVRKLTEISADYSVTVFHGLDTIKGAVFLKSPNPERFMTIVYGAEIYNNREIIGEKIIGEKSKELFELSNSSTVLDVIKDIYRSIAYRNNKKPEDVDLKNVLYKMNVFGSLPSISYEKYHRLGIYNETVKRIPFSYYPIEFVIKDKSLRVQGTDILLGNSASATNNHLEAFDLLKQCELGDRKVITPLSYGRKRYAQAVASSGQKELPGNFKPLTEFLPLEEYNKIMSRCGVVVMNHYRPEAMGNIIAALYMGAKVFLNNTDAYKYFKGMGCHIYLIQDDLLGGEHALNLLSDALAHQNRKILRNELSSSNLIKKMRTSFEEVFEYSTELSEAV